METTPIKIPRAFGPNRFAIPLVKVDERAAMKDFDEYRDLLKRWGFECAISARSLSHNYMQKGLPGNKIETHEMWYHPKGVLAQIGSYSTVGYKDYRGNDVPPRVQLGHLYLEAKVDLGTGRELQQRGGVEIIGGGVSPLLDGRAVHSTNEIAHSNTVTGLYEFMDNIQRHGRLIPFDEWDPKQMTNHSSLAPEIVFPVQSWDKDEEFKIEPEVWEPALQKAIDQTPPVIAALLHRNDEYDRMLRKGDLKNRQRRWNKVEFGIDVFSEALFLGGMRWLKPEQRQILQHWSEVALGEKGDVLDPVSMRAYEEGPAGLSLPVALLYAKTDSEDQQNDIDHSSQRNAASRLLKQILESAPIEVLHRWATQTDAAGYTLGLRAVARSFTERSITSHTPPDVDVLGILHRRLGPEGLVMITPTRSVLGLALQDAKLGDSKESSNDEKARLVKHQDLVRAIERLDDWGVEWASALRWRIYPNLYTNKQKPAFFRIDEPVDPGRFRQMMGSSFTDALEPLISCLDRWSLRQKTPSASCVSTLRTPRL